MQLEIFLKPIRVLKNVVERTPLDFDRYLSEKIWGDCLSETRKYAKGTAPLRFVVRITSFTNYLKGQKEGGLCFGGKSRAGVAFTCHGMKIPATIFMPVTTPQQKIGQVRFLVAIM